MTSTFKYSKDQQYHHRIIVEFIYDDEGGSITVADDTFNGTIEEAREYGEKLMRKVGGNDFTFYPKYKL